MVKEKEHRIRNTMNTEKGSYDDHTCAKPLKAVRWGLIGSTLLLLGIGELFLLFVADGFLCLLV